MESLTYLFAVVAIFAAVLASLAIWSRRRAWPRIAAVVTVALFVPAAYAGFLGLLGKPKPVALEWVAGRAGEATVLDAVVREREGIYLWLELDGISEPRSYVLPWSRALALDLQAARREAEENGGDLRLKRPFEPGWDDQEPRFYAQPQPALPPKDAVPDMKPQEYEPPDVQI